jgi:hypothetical protein
LSPRTLGSAGTKMCSRTLGTPIQICTRRTQGTRAH